jgi:hypothetical protein
MAVSVKSGRSGQQIPRIPPEAFSLTLDEDGEVAAKIIELSQSETALHRLPNKRGSMRHSIETDPVSYDAFFTVDLSRSMDRPRPQGEGPDRSHRDLAVSLIRKITEGESRDKGGVLGRGDRILVSGFDNTVQKDLMSGLTADRAAVLPALAALLEYSPRSENTALFAAIHQNLTYIEGLAPSYSGMSRRREAVLFVITDSFNGRDLGGRRNLSRCTQNTALLDTLIERIKTIQAATDQGLRVYILALGDEGRARGYAADKAPSRSCRPTNAQKNTTDGFSFRRLTDPDLGSGGSISSLSEEVLFTFVRDEFELRRRPYKLKYELPKGARSPSRYELSVQLEGVTCSDAIRSSGDIVPPMVAGVDLETSSAEMALFLASLLISMLFIPRTVTNLRASFGRGGDSS